MQTDLGCLFRDRASHQTVKPKMLQPRMFVQGQSLPSDCRAQNIANRPRMFVPGTEPPIRLSREHKLCDHYRRPQPAESWAHNVPTDRVSKRSSPLPYHLLVRRNSDGCEAEPPARLPMTAFVRSRMLLLTASILSMISLCEGFCSLSAAVPSPSGGKAAREGE